ncbi:MAG: ABC transporter permease [Clostridiales bacterium]|nr:ABC transporter permease [Clostridiales bacterium]
MSAIRFFFYDIKRLFYHSSLLSLCLFSPLIVVLIFSLVVSPMIFTGRGLHFNLALCNEDESTEVKEFINQLVNSQALIDLVSVYPVDTVEKGIELAEKGKVSVFVHVPQNVFSDIREGDDTRAAIYGTNAHSLEMELITIALDSSLSVVGKSQNVMEAARLVLLEKGESVKDAEVFLDNATGFALNEYMGRRELLGQSGPISPLGEHLPIEYYISAIFSIFAALSMLPLIHFSAADSHGPILRRGLLCGIGAGRFFAARIASGTIFIFLVLTMLFPSSIILRLSGKLLGGTYVSSFAALLFSMFLTALVFSALALVIATWLPGEKTALWFGFFLTVFMAVFCGALIPESALPKMAAIIGKWLPLRTSLRMLSLLLFNFSYEAFTRDALKSLGFAAFLLPLGLWGLKRRGYPT